MTDPRTTVAAAARYRAGVVAVTPVLLLVAAAWHPYIPGRLPNDTAVAETVLPDPTRWGLAHLAAGVAFGFAVLAFVAIRNQLREAGEQRWSGAGLPLVVLGTAMYTMLPGMELAPLAAAESGADVAAVQVALEPWFVPVLIAGAGLFVLGTVGFAAGIIRSGLLGPGTAGLVVTALVVMAVPGWCRWWPFNSTCRGWRRWSRCGRWRTGSGGRLDRPHDQPRSGGQLATWKVASMPAWMWWSTWQW